MDIALWVENAFDENRLRNLWSVAINPCLRRVHNGGLQDVRAHPGDGRMCGLTAMYRF